MMISKILSFILIATMLTCPLGCGLSVSACCAATASADGPGEENQRTCCCGEPDQQKKQSPADAPREQNGSCQGICGGAVVEEMFPAPSDVSFQPPVTFEQQNLRSESEVCEFGRGEGDLTRPPLRLLHMSFLC